MSYKHTNYCETEENKIILILEVNKQTKELIERENYISCCEIQTFYNFY